LLAQKGDGLRPFSAGRERQSVDLDRTAQRRGEPGIAVQLASAQEIESQFARLGGVRLGLVVSVASSAPRASQESAAASSEVAPV